MNGGLSCLVEVVASTKVKSLGELIATNDNNVVVGCLKNQNFKILELMLRNGCF